MKKLIALLLALTLLLCGCGGKASASQDLMEDVEPTGQSKPLVTIGTDTPDTFDPETDEPWDNVLIGDFGLRLLRASFDEKKNTLISPLSILSALAMTANGAEGNTLAQMETVLGQSRGALNSWYKFGTAYEDAFLHQANGIWFRDNPSLMVKEEFLQKNAEYFDAGIYKAPFDETTLQDINSFVEDHTHGMIKDILDEIPEEAVMYLVNALAFEAQWQEVYKENQVHDGTFLTENSLRQEIRLMWSEERLYYENDLVTGFQKPYKGGKIDRFAFVALLPKEGVSMADLVAGLDGVGLREILANPQVVTVNAAIPKFEAEFDVEMRKILEAMGMTDAFDSSLADFSSLGSSENGNIYLSRVIHETFISVAEKGTKAGAATVEEAAAEGAMEEIKQVVLDRPFLYMIVDTENNTPIFIGALMNMGEEDTLCIDHSHSPAEVPYVLENPATGYCGNTQTTVHLDGEDYTFMYDDSVTLTDLLINLDYDPDTICRCMAEFTVDTEFMENFQVNLEQAFVRCERGQAPLTEEQVQTIREIINRL